jgi:hypothetical protein
MASISTGRETVRGNIQRIFSLIYNGSTVNTTVHLAISQGNMGVVQFTMAAEFPNGGAYENGYTIWVEIRDGESSRSGSRRRGGLLPRCSPQASRCHRWARPRSQYHLAAAAEQRYRSAAVVAMNQLPQSIADEFAHDERRAGPPDPSDVQDLAGDAVEIVGVSPDDLDEQVRVAAQSVNLHHLGDIRKCHRHFGEQSLFEAGHDEGLHRIAQERRFYPAVEFQQHLAVRPPVQMSLDGVAGHTDIFSESDGRRARVPG